MAKFKVAAFMLLMVAASEASDAIEVIGVLEEDGNPEAFLQGINETFSDLGNKEMEARWIYITDITTQHEEEMARI